MVFSLVLLIWSSKWYLNLIRTIFGVFLPVISFSIFMAKNIEWSQDFILVYLAISLIGGLFYVISLGSLIGLDSILENKLDSKGKRIGLKFGKVGICIFALTTGTLATYSTIIVLLIAIIGRLF